MDLASFQGLTDHLNRLQGFRLSFRLYGGLVPTACCCMLHLAIPFLAAPSPIASNVHCTCIAIPPFYPFYRRLRDETSQVELLLPIHPPRWQPLGLPPSKGGPSTKVFRSVLLTTGDLVVNFRHNFLSSAIVAFRTRDTSQIASHATCLTRYSTCRAISS